MSCASKGEPQLDNHLVHMVGVDVEVILDIRPSGLKNQILTFFSQTAAQPQLANQPGQIQFPLEAAG